MAMELDTDKLAEVVRRKRGDEGLRAVAYIVGVSPSTLSRVEQGHVPDVDTYLRLCRWLDVSADFFSKSVPHNLAGEPRDVIIAHLRAEKTLPSSVAAALIELIQTAYLAHNKA